SAYAAHGRYLFWNRPANRLFAIVQADPSSGFLNDFAIYTISLDGSCSGTLSSASNTVGAAQSTGSVAVTAAASCAWRAVSNAPWITITQNVVSAGNATLTYWVDANTTTVARTGTISIAGQIYTITQAAGSPANASAVSLTPFRVSDAEYSRALDRI